MARRTSSLVSDLIVLLERNRQLADHNVRHSCLSMSVPVCLLLARPNVMLIFTDRVMIIQQYIDCHVANLPINKRYFR
jgi:hypothetical protein